MTSREEEQEFGELSLLYCKNIGIIKTFEQRLRRDQSKLADRLKTGASEFGEEWEVQISLTYCWIRKRDWKKAGIKVLYEVTFTPEHIGEHVVKQDLKIEDQEVRKQMCNNLGRKLKDAFKVSIDSTNMFIFHDNLISLGDSTFEDTIINAMNKFISFSPEIDLWIKKRTGK